MFKNCSLCKVLCMFFLHKISDMEITLMSQISIVLNFFFSIVKFKSGTCYLQLIIQLLHRNYASIVNNLI